MGKQTAIALTEKDEELFLEFLHSTAPISIYRTKARFAEDIRIDRFPPRGQDEWQYLISNENFLCDPSFVRFAMIRQSFKVESGITSAMQVQRLLSSIAATDLAMRILMDVCIGLNFLLRLRFVTTWICLTSGTRRLLSG